MKEGGTYYRQRLLMDRVPSGYTVERLVADTELPTDVCMSFWAGSYVNDHDLDEIEEAIGRVR